MLTSMLLPCFVFTIILIINFANWLEDSSATLSFPTILVLLLFYCMLSVPNVWLGSFIGFKKPTIKNPGKINKLSRDIPKQPWYLRMRLLIPMGGLVPFL
jgi:transmembrane 9 superfamily member 2/4